MARDIALTGLPRSGTTLVCQLLGGLPDSVALIEPMKVAGFPALGAHSAIAGEIAGYFGRMRTSLLTNGKAESAHTDGAMTDNTFEAPRTDGNLRQNSITRGEVSIDKPLTADFTLCIKHIAAFTAVLQPLSARLPVYAMVRNPLSVLASWSTVDTPINRGHIPAAEGLDAMLAKALLAEDDPLARQLHILDWFFERFSRFLSKDAVLRYEDIVASGGAALSVIVPAAAGLKAQLANRNQSYSDRRLQLLAERLLDSDGAYWNYYSRESVAELARGA
ncbi:MAG TPA: hypothetical protein VGH91_03490 [Gammaproteobacteria bacterium]|jgi:hypothetical protein